MEKAFLIPENTIKKLVLESVTTFLNNLLNEDWSHFQLTGTQVIKQTETLSLDLILSAPHSDHLKRDRSGREKELLQPGKIGEPLASFFCKPMSGMDWEKDCPLRIHTITSSGVLIITLDKDHHYKIVTLYEITDPNTLVKYIKIGGNLAQRKLQPALRRLEHNSLLSGGHIGNDYKKFLLPEEPKPEPKEEPKSETEPSTDVQAPPTGTENGETAGTKAQRKKRPRINRFRPRINESLFSSIIKSVLSELDNK